MSKLNEVKQGTRTFEGGRGRRFPNEEELALLSFSSNFHNKFYESGNTTLTRMQALVRQVQPEFVQRLASVVRQEFNMRASAAALLAFSTLENGQPSREAIKDVFFRGDELGDYLAIVSKYSDNGKIIPSAARFARKVLQSQLTERKALRYNRDNHIWGLAKAIRISHARMDASLKQQALFNFILKWSNNSLKSAWDETSLEDRKRLPLIEKAVMGIDTEGDISWERTKSNGGDWISVVHHMGYMALLRNLRNFLETIPTENNDFWEYVISRIDDEEEVQASRQLPIRFYSAYQAITGIEHERVAQVVNALSMAIGYSSNYMPTLSGNTLIVVDASGSMETSLSTNSKMTYRKVGEVLAASLFHATGAEVVHFATSAHKWKDLQVNETILETVRHFSMITSSLGWGTELYSILKKVSIHNYDNIVIFSDMQLSDSANRIFNTYKGKLFTVNLAGYEVGLNIDRNVINVGGWSDAIFKLMAILSRDTITDYVNSNGQSL